MVGDNGRASNAHDEIDTAELLRRLEQASEPAETEAVEELDLVRQLQLDPAADPEAGKDSTLGGYIEKHDRPPAFLGIDEQPYTVGLGVEPGDGADPPFIGFLMFVRWAASGAGIMGHVESDDLSRGATEDEARGRLLDLSLYEVKAALDAAVERQQGELYGNAADIESPPESTSEDEADGS
ncbi:MAG: hypothetical protein ACRELD_02475 [Longimicrobiales bacterium]